MTASYRHRVRVAPPILGEGDLQRAFDYLRANPDRATANMLRGLRAYRLHSDRIWFMERNGKTPKFSFRLGVPCPAFHSVPMLVTFPLISGRDHYTCYWRTIPMTALGIPNAVAT